VAPDALDSRRVRAAFRAEVRRATRTTAIAGGAIAIVCFPAWAIFDHLVDPAHGARFAGLRFALELPLIALWLTLFTRPGRRHPEVVMLLMLGFIQGAIGYMTTHVVDAYAPYALGMSLAIYASSYLLIWPWQYTAALIGMTWTALLIGIATAPPTLDAAAVATIVFYLATASLIAFVGQLHRQATAWREFRYRVELEAEQERSRDLLSQLERLSREDALTGLANRRSWDETLAREFERARRHDGALAVLLCDVDHLKEINDRYGHAAGDRVLQATAELLRDRIRAGDHAARLGGDEFGIICPDTGLTAALALADDVRARVGALTPADTSVPAVTVSIGVACREPADLSPAEMVMRADDRLYSAKRARTPADLTSAG
jgi:diguanylate cyclase (GGDEF)-like protein